MCGGVRWPLPRVVGEFSPPVHPGVWGAGVPRAFRALGLGAGLGPQGLSPRAPVLGSGPPGPANPAPGPRAPRPPSLAVRCHPRTGAAVGASVGAGPRGCPDVPGGSAFQSRGCPQMTRGPGFGAGALGSGGAGAQGLGPRAPGPRPGAQGLGPGAPAPGHKHSDVRPCPLQPVTQDSLRRAQMNVDIRLAPGPGSGLRAPGPGTGPRAQGPGPGLGPGLWARAPDKY